MTRSPYRALAKERERERSADQAQSRPFVPKHPVRNKSRPLLTALLAFLLHYLGAPMCLAPYPSPDAAEIQPVAARSHVRDKRARVRFYDSPRSREATRERKKNEGKNRGRKKRTKRTEKQGGEIARGIALAGRWCITRYYPSISTPRCCANAERTCRASSLQHLLAHLRDDHVYSLFI